ncbi:MAG: hypothetical protein J6W21_02000 [Bacteroidaceae bacterium]|nr:hypothetical protein [Bacteroidaceae bacterium]
MKRLLTMVVVITSMLHAMADDYSYLTFELTDGTKTSVSSTALTITIQNGKLMVGSQEFNLTDLSKMYFSFSDDSADVIKEVNRDDFEEVTDIYDLQGRKVNEEQMKSGIYVIKTKKGTFKVSVR